MSKNSGTCSKQPSEPSAPSAMSSKYQKPLTIPAAFPELLKGFTREVLRAQPDNIYEFAAQHFQHLLELRDDANPASAQKLQNAVQQGPAPVQGVQATAQSLNIAQLSPAELEPILLSELGSCIASVCSLCSGACAFASRAHDRMLRHCTACLDTACYLLVTLAHTAHRRAVH